MGYNLNRTNYGLSTSTGHLYTLLNLPCATANDGDRLACEIVIVIPIGRMDDFPLERLEFPRDVWYTNGSYTRETACFTINMMCLYGIC